MLKSNAIEKLKKDYLPLTGGTLTDAKATNKIDINPNDVEVVVSTILERRSEGLGYNVGDNLSLRLGNSPFEGAFITVKDNVWNELNSTIYLGRGITTIRPHHESNDVTFRTKDNLGNLQPISRFEPNGEWHLGDRLKVWNNCWAKALRTTDGGIGISANDNGTDLVGRNGLWINTTGIRPLNGDGTMTCGENTHRWNIVWSINGVTQTSDRELKKNIKRIDVSTTRNIDANTKFYNFVRDDLKFYSWDWKQENLNTDMSTNIGVIAQELEQSEVGKMIVIPPKEIEIEKQVIGEDDDATIEKETVTTNYAINERNMYMSLGIALKQAINEIETLKQEIEVLKSK